MTSSYSQDFRQLFHVLGVKGCSNVPKSTLVDLLLYHVVGENLLNSDLKDGEEYVSLEGSSIHIDVKYRKVYVDGAKILDANILASNGVIHEIDQVLEIK